jgi:hypothetical protein
MGILKLTLHPTKTRVVDMGHLTLPESYPMAITCSAQNPQHHRRRLSSSEVIKFLNRVIRGWRNYFRIGN